MKDKIRILPELIANQIAAGEVIERPASVIKELVENSIDAGATRINVSVRGSGVSEMVVVDNGEGMTPNDAIAAFERFATSKVSTSNDIFNIRTMGFRGEAIPSIGSVSNVELITKPAVSVSGTRVEVNGGTIKKVEDTAAPDGTRFSVRNLFFNTPARRKHLRSVETEFNHIQKAVMHIAMANPSVFFQLEHNERMAAQYPAVEDHETRISQVFGGSIKGTLFEVGFPAEMVSGCGYFARPNFTRKNRQLQHIYINKRHVRCFPLAKIIDDCYRGLVARDRYPAYFLFLDIDPEMVDVNVHPAKREVRFGDERLIFGQVRRALMEGLESLNVSDLPSFIPESELQAREPGIQPSKPRPSSPNAFKRHDYRNKGPDEFDAPVIKSRGHQHSTDIPEYKPKTRFQPQVQEQTEQARDRKSVFSASIESSHKSITDDQDLFRGDVVDEDIFSKVSIYHQIDNTFIVGISRDELFLIDQHVAHERIMFERLSDSDAGRKGSRQNLLIPEVIELSPPEYMAIKPYLGILEELGLPLEEFGDNTLIIRSIPAYMDKADLAGTIKNMADDLSDTDSTTELDEIKLDIISLISCKASIKAGQRLKQEEIDSLIAQLAGTRNPFTCPHGRPIIVRLDRAALEKIFHRRK